MSIPSDRPVYRILATAGFFGPDDHLYEEGDIIVFLDEPNDEMEPMNDLAREKQHAYFDKLDALAKAAAEKAGRQYAGRARSLDEAIAIASQDARRVQLVRGDGGVPLMGAKHHGPARVEKIVDEAVTPPDGRRGKLSLTQR